MSCDNMSDECGSTRLMDDPDDYHLCQQSDEHDGKHSCVCGATW